MFKSIRVGAARSPLTVVGIFAEEDDLPRGLKLGAGPRKALKEAIKTPGFKADVGETAHAGEGYLLLGLGKKADLKPATLRTVGAKLAQSMVQAPKHVDGDEKGDVEGEGRASLGACPEPEAAIKAVQAVPVSHIWEVQDE